MTSVMFQQYYMANYNSTAIVQKNEGNEYKIVTGHAGFAFISTLDNE